MSVEAVVDPGSRKTRTRALFIGLALGFWSTAITLSNAYAIFRGAVYKLEYFPVDVLLAIMAAGISSLLTVALRRAARLSVLAQVTGVATLSLVGAIVCAVSSRILVLLFAIQGVQSELTIKSVLIGSLYWYAPMSLWTAMYLASHHYRQTRHDERRLAAVRIEAHEAQVRALRYQVNPHFLYNTLNSVAALILDQRNEQAEQMVLRLAAFFRASLENDPLVDVPLGQELAMQRHYLAIEQVRFASRLDIKVDIPVEVQAALIPSLILQPIVENSLKHGAPDQGEVLQVTLAARREGGNLVIEVTNNGVGYPSAAKLPSSGTGTGLSNVRSRLASRYGSSAMLGVRRASDRFIVRLTMPFQQA